MERSFYLLDVFAEGYYSGNQLAVFRNAASLSAAEMQHLSREVHFSETAFILSDEPGEGGYEVRVFTPSEEIPFSGHAVLGAAYVLQREVLTEPLSGLEMKLGAGSLAISLDYQYGELDTVWVNHNSPEHGRRFEAAGVAAALGLSTDDIDERWPVEELSTGLPFLMVPLRSLSAVQKAALVPEEYARLLAASTARGLYVFAHETYNPDNDFNVRMFAPDLGIPEDPATGAGAGCLAAYAMKYMRPDSTSLDLMVEQGHEIRRPSLLFARARRGADSVKVAVGGRVALVAQGSFV
jgi:trans-2,3-dihydro-3-hydroxyanthranilate isomerase